MEEERKEKEGEGRREKGGERGRRERRRMEELQPISYSHTLLYECRDEEERMESKWKVYFDVNKL